MSSESSTERGTARAADSSFQPWHFYLLVSLAGATWAVIVARDTHPAALVLLSAGIVSAGLVGAALHYALTGLFGANVREAPVTGRTREFLEQEKALLLRTLKELEFDRAMRKVGEQDFTEISGRLRARAMEIMERLEKAEPEAALAPGRKGSAASSPEDHPACPSCGMPTDPDARFCKHCGVKL
jgi:hypothetical protein